MKIYVVTAGNYSDYTILGVSTNKDIAEAFAKISGYDEPRVEEYDDIQDMSIIEKAKRMVPRWAIMFEVNGELHYLTEDDPVSYSEPMDPEIKPYGMSDLLVAHVSAEDKDHAIKIARDLRVKYLSEKFGL